MLVACVVLLPAGATARTQGGDAATLRALNRDVITMRATLAGASPAVSVQRPEQRPAQPEHPVVVPKSHWFSAPRTRNAMPPEL
jgi:hypothetical protein